MDFQEAFAGHTEMLKGLSGVDWSDIYFQRSAVKSLLFNDGKIEEVSSSSVGGCSARLQKGRRSALAVVSGVEKGAGGKALAEACRIASVSAPRQADRDFPFARPQVYFPEDVQFFRDVDAALRHECPWIRQVTLSGSSAVRDFGVVSSEGGTTGRLQRNSFTAYVLLEREGRVESGYSALSCTGGAKAFFQELDPEAVARKALQEALTGLEAVECPSGAMPVVLADSAGGTIIHEACGHGMEADLVFEEQSCFKDKIGGSVAAECVTIADDPTIPGLYGSYDCDDEGVPATRTVLVERGILKNYLSDRRSSRLYGVPLTGNGRRMSFSSLPMPRMSNTFVLSGEDDQNEMIQRVPRGLLVCRMGGGEVNTTTGEFVFDVTQGYMIEGGKVTRPVKGASLIGSALDVLKGIKAVGKRLCMEPGMCEKEGQSLPVTDGQPSLLIDGLVVGGTATDHEIRK